MSKSIGNVILMKDLLNEYDPNVIRLSLLSTKYRNPINFSEDLLSQSSKTLHKIKKYYDKINIERFLTEENSQEIRDIVSMDFNIPNLITYLLDIMKEEETPENQNIFLSIINILGIEFQEQKEEEIPEKIISLIDKRTKMKQEKKYEEADQIRKEISELGYEIKDTSQGVECKKIKQ
jgi:cysteinyl-tRNA synthetase